MLLRRRLLVSNPPQGKLPERSNQNLLRLPFLESHIPPTRTAAIIRQNAIKIGTTIQERKEGVEELTQVASREVGEGDERGFKVL